MISAHLCVMAVLMVFRYIYEKYGGFQVMKVETIGDCELIHMRVGMNEQTSLNEQTAMNEQTSLNEQTAMNEQTSMNEQTAMNEQTSMNEQTVMLDE